jgi:hypothetical protein
LWEEDHEENCSSSHETVNSDLLIQFCVFVSSYYVIFQHPVALNYNL